MFSQSNSTKLFNTFSLLHIRFLLSSNTIHMWCPSKWSKLFLLISEQSPSLERKSESHYVWMEPDINRYRSRFNPMRIHDVIRDDMAVRMWRPGTLPALCMTSFKFRWTLAGPHRATAAHSTLKNDVTKKGEGVRDFLTQGHRAYVHDKGGWKCQNYQDVIYIG